jgi:hypothetical protein
VPAIVATGVLFVLLLAPIPGRFSAPWIGALQDLTHVPLFAIFPGLLARVAGCGPWSAAAMAFALAVVIEPIQDLVGRSANLDDLIRGTFGIALSMSWRLSAAIRPSWRRWALRLAALGVCGGIPLAGAWPTLADAVASYQAFPVLADFSSREQWRRWKIDGCQLNCEPRAEGLGVGMLRSFADSKRPPSIILFPILRDWSRYDGLNVEFELDGDPLAITLSVRDGRRVKPPRRRFDRFGTYAAGRHRVTLDLKAIARGAPAVAPIDVAAVQSFHIIIEQLGTDRIVRLRRIWLE